MKKAKRLVALLLGFGLAISSAACGVASQGQTEWTMEQAYSEAQELGYEGTWAEFSEAMDGVDGVGIASVSMNENGQLVVTLLDNRTIVLGKVDPNTCAHSYNQGEGVEPTCEKVGYGVQVCSSCGNVKYDFVPALGHDWQLIDYWVEPTETEAGVGIYACPNCLSWKVDGITDEEGDSGNEDEPEIEENTKTTLYVTLQNMGYGSVWLENIVEAFETYYADYSFEEGKKGVQVFIERTKTRLDPNVVQASASDLYFVYENSANTSNLLYGGVLEDITDAVTQPWGAESVSALEKLPSGKALTVEGKTYTMPYADMQYVLTYNANIFERYDFEVPNTTDELIMLCDEMMYRGITPFTSSGMYPDLFWENLPEIWWAQYEGADAYARYWNGVNENGEYSPDNASQEGRLKALQTFESVVKEDYLSYESFTAAYNHLDAIERYFMSEYDSRNQEIAMMPYLDCMYMEVPYIVDEMQNIYGPNAVPNVRVMKTPVISSIIEKCSTIPDDETLSAVIDAIDQGMTSYTGVSDEDFHRVAAARGVTINQDSVSAFVVADRNKTQLAKEFLRFVASDDGIAIAANAGMKTLFHYEYSQEQLEAFDPVTRDVLLMNQSSNTVCLPSKYTTRLYMDGLRAWNGVSVQGIRSLLTGQISSGQLFEETIAYYAQKLAQFS